MIKVGDKVPEMKLMMATADGPKETSTAALFGGRRAVLFAVPGAFTPTCSARHLPGYLDNIDALAGKGIESIVCMAVNDGYVMGAWARDQGVDGRVTMVADGTGAFTKALGLELDLSARGLGIRSQRFAMVLADGTVESLAIEAPGDFEVSKAESVLASL